MTDLDPNYVVTSDVDTYFVDKDTAQAMSNGTLYFYKDNARTVSKPVYTLTGAPPSYSYVSLGSTITLSQSGTVQDSSGNNVLIYYYPYDDNGDIELYYVVCTDQNGNVQFTREGWPNVTAASGDVTKNSLPATNQISNAQFTNADTLVGVNKTNTFSVSGNATYPICPDWNLVVSGTGNVNVTIVPNSGTSGIPSNPPFSFSINVSGSVSTCYLTQRFYFNAGLWSSANSDNYYLNLGFIAKDNGGTNPEIKFYFNQYPGVGSPVLLKDQNVTGNYTRYTSSTLMPTSANPNSGAAGYVDFYVSFSPGNSVSISSIQLIPSIGGALTTVPNELDSSNRNLDYQSNYYIPRLNAKTLSSYLIGWDFPVNPYQFGGAPVSPITTNAYTCDQTIILPAAANTVNVTRETGSGALQLSFTGSNQAFGVMQYLSGDLVNDLLAKKLSINVFAYQVPGVTFNSSLSMQVNLLYGTNSATIPTLPAAIGTVPTNGNFSLTSGNWALVPRSGLSGQPSSSVAVYSQDNANNGLLDYGFSGYDTSAIPFVSTTAFFALVITFASGAGAGCKVVLNSVSLVPGDIPCRPNPQNPQDVLRECEYFYERSYGGAVPSGTVGQPSGILYPAIGLINGANTEVHSTAFQILFKTRKRTVPIATIFGGTQGNTPDTVSAAISIAGGAMTFNSFALPFSGKWTSVTTTAGLVSLIFQPTSDTVLYRVANTSTSFSAYMVFDYNLDARIGI